jgi:hypothetical protein
MFRLFMVIRLVILLGPPNSFRPPAFRDGSMNMALAVIGSSSFRRHSLHVGGPDEASVS